jgi:polyprenyldihydroxybenzoate methyltransferase/3-demethylubiquinol 3-O-methyltransferase
MNPKRVEFVKEKLLEAAREDQGEAIAARMESGGKPLAGMDILDVGCGGGLLSEVCEL